MSRDISALAKAFDVVDEHQRQLTALTVDLSVYLDHGLAEHSDALVRALDAYLKLVPRETLTWYRTETMTRGKPCTARSLAIPKTWFRAGSPGRIFRFLEARDGSEYHSVAHAGLRISSRALEPGEKRPWEPSQIRFMFPVSWAEQNSAAIVQLALQLANDFPLVSGHAGFCVERNFAYYDQASIIAAYPLAMRYQGVDIDYRLTDEEFEFLKTINWLTIVGAPLVERAGGADALRAQLAEQPGVTVHQAKQALVIQASELPEFGDVNRAEWLPNYRAVYRALGDLFAPEFTLAFRLTTLGDASADPERTEAWYRRFEREIPSGANA